MRAVVCVVLALALSLSGVDAQAAASTPCDFTTSNCTISNSGSSVDLSGTRPGGSAGDSGGSEGHSGGGRSDQPERTLPATTPCDRVVDPLCRGDSGLSVGVLQPTLTDVASFAPAALALVDEPDGVGVVGMPMNFVVEAAAHEATGELFDLPVTVRFTPASVVFVHGDGTSRTSTTGGRTWAQLGQAQFSATSTSHAYSTRGTFTARGVVRYAAAVDFGNGWVPVPGLLEIPTPSTNVQILEVRTALVDKTCAERPTGPGC